MAGKGKASARKLVLTGEESPQEMRDPDSRESPEKTDPASSDPVSLVDGSESELASGPGDAWDVLKGLPDTEKAFVLDVLRGESYENAARANGWTGELAPVRLIGRPRIRIALERLAPLLPDSRRAARILAPYLMADSFQAISTGGPGTRDIRRDLLSIAGVAGVSRTEHVTASLSEILGALDKRTAGKRPAELVDAQIVPDSRRLGSGSTDT